MNVRQRILAIARGATINGTYRQSPGDSLESFRHDLLTILGETCEDEGCPHYGTPHSHPEE